MARVTGFTAERMQTIEDTSIVGGAVLLDDLILTQRDGTQINAGNVRGPQGLKGDQGIQGIQGFKGDKGDQGIQGIQGIQGLQGVDGVQGSSATPAGTITLWASDVAPANWLICDGSAVSRTTYASLFATIGTKYGAGDGVNTFNLPNLKGQTPVGKDTTQTEFAALNQKGGEKAHLLTAAESGLPAHNHLQDPHSHIYVPGPQYKQVTVQSGTGNVNMWGGPDVTAWASSTTATNQPNAAANAAQAHNVLQPYTVVNFIIKFTNGDSPNDSQLTQRVSTLETFTGASPAGTITIWGGDSPPTNWLVCDGAAISRTTYASLFAAIGTKYGAGDGSATFNLPNFKGRTPAGLDATQTEFNALGKTGGEKAHLLTAAESGLPSHNHIQDPHSHTFQTDDMGPASGFGGIPSAMRASTYNYTAYEPTSTTTATNQANAAANAAQAHNVLSPYLTVNYIIKFTNGDTQGDSQLTQRVSALETGNNTFAVLDRERTRLQRVLSGGGVRKVSATGISWLNPFVTPSAARDANVPSGTFVMYMPPNGTVIPVYYANGVTSATVANGAVPLSGWQALYFEVPFGQVTDTSFTTNRYRILDYTTDQAFTIPPNWILICARVADGVSPLYTWGDGRSQDFWHDVTFQNGWRNYAGGYNNAGYRVSSSGQIELRGLVAAGTASVIFQLPSFYGPETMYLTEVHAGGGSARIDVQTNGAVNMAGYYAGGTNGYVSLDQISFYPAGA